MPDQTVRSGKPPYFGAPGFADSYWIELLYNQPPSVDIDALDARLRAEVAGEVAIRAVAQSGGTLSVAFPGHLVKLEGSDGVITPMPSLINIVWTDSRIKIADYKAALDQTWEWNGARKALAGCFNMMLIGDLTGSRLPYPDRLRLITAVAVECTQLTQPRAVVWKEAGCLVEPSILAERMARACNVRLFEVGVRGDHFMDTLGLAAIGLPDIQLRFSKLEPSWVAGWLYGVARYMFEQGDVIEDGDVIPAPTPGEHWACQHGTAAVPPARTVIDVTPGSANAPAG
jgi:hypothetical protein